MSTLLAATAIVATIGSYHFDRSEPMEEFNPGLGVEVAVTDRVYFGAGGYRNSFGDFTTYAGAGLRLWQIGPVSLGAELAKADGYDDIPYIGGVVISGQKSGFKIMLNNEIVALQYRF